MKQRQRKEPVYQRLSSELRSAIEEGRFDGGERLPTEAELCQQYGVSRHTVRQAFQGLVAEGLVHRVPGRGTFVTGLSKRGQYLRSIGTIEEVMSWPGTEMELVRPLRAEADAEAAARLGLASTWVSVMVVRRLYEGVPFAVTRIYFAPELGGRLEAEGVPSEGYTTVIETVKRLIPLPIAGASQSITAVPAPEDLTAAIGCHPGEPVLRAERLYFDTDQNPVEFTVSHYNPRRYFYRLELRQRV